LVLDLLIQILIVNQIILLLGCSESHLIVFDLFQLTRKVNNLEVAGSILSLELFKLVLVEGRLNLVLSYVTMDLNFSCKVHDYNVIVRFCDKLLSFFVRLDKFDRFMISLIHVFLQANRFGKITNLFYSFAFGSE
jgi:hypothetical protein